MSELARAQVDESEVTRSSKSEEQILLLVRRAQSGDEDAFAVLFGIFKSIITAFVGRRLQYSADVDDVVQKTFISAHKYIGRFRFESKFSTWLHIIAKRKCHDYIRSKCRFEDVSLEEVRSCAARNGWSENVAIATIIAEKILPQMDPVKREIVVRVFDGDSSSEIASDLGMKQQKIRDTMKAFLKLLEHEVEAPAKKQRTVRHVKRK
jgi:RNA polymerase sigma-70 factor (ECF subfamily)